MADDAFFSPELAASEPPPCQRSGLIETNEGAEFCSRVSVCLSEHTLMGSRGEWFGEGSVRLGIEEGEGVGEHVL